MGTGKSTIGHLLANHLHIPYIDTDDEIIKTENSSIPDLFSEKGEEYFRKMETKVLFNVINKSNPSVISTGGGIILAEENIELIKQHCIILLEASPEEIYERIKHNKSRPLLSDSGADMLKNIKKMLKERKDLYQKHAKISIITESKGKNQIIQEILPQITDCIK